MGVLNNSLQEVDAAFVTLNPLIYNIVAALVILFAGFIIGRILSNVVKRLLQMADMDKTIMKLTRINFRFERSIPAIIGFVVYLTAIILALIQVGLLSIIIAWLAYFVVIAILIGFGLGLRDIFPNVFAGLILKRKMELQKGKKLAVGNIKGKIVYMNTLYVHVRNEQGDLLLIPFSQLLREKSTVH